MITQMFPPIPTPDFSPNFTGYDLDNIDWYTAYEEMAQSPSDAILRVSISLLHLMIYKTFHEEKE